MVDTYILLAATTDSLSICDCALTTILQFKWHRRLRKPPIYVQWLQWLLELLLSRLFLLLWWITTFQ